MCSFGVILSQGPNERKVLSSIVSSNMTQMPVAAKHESTEQEEVDDGAGVDGAEVGPAAFAEEAANNPVEEDAPNTTADSQDGDDDNQAEHHKPYVGEEKTHEEVHHKTSLMLGVSAEMEQQNPAQTDGSPDPTKSKRPPGRPKGAKDSRPRTRRRKAEISAIRSATAAGMPVGMGMGFPHHQVKLLIACRSEVSVYEYDVAQVFQHHHMGGGHEMALQGMHGMDMSGFARPGFQGLRNMWGGGKDPSMGDMGMVRDELQVDGRSLWSRRRAFTRRWERWQRVVTRRGAGCWRGRRFCRFGTHELNVRQCGPVWLPKPERGGWGGHVRRRALRRKVRAGSAAVRDEPDDDDKRHGDEAAAWRRAPFFARTIRAAYAAGRAGGPSVRRCRSRRAGLTASPGNCSIKVCAGSRTISGVDQGFGLLGEGRAALRTRGRGLCGL